MFLSRFDSETLLLCTLSVLLGASLPWLCLRIRRRRHPKSVRAGIPAPDRSAPERVPACRSVPSDFAVRYLRLVEIRSRSDVYVSTETKRTIAEVVRKIGGERMTLTSYVENILREHLENNREEINRLFRQCNTEKIL